MVKRMLVGALVFAVLPFLMAASITLDKTSNPKNYTLRCEGTYKFGAGEKGPTYLWAQATLKGSNPPQTTSAQDPNPQGGNWTVDMLVAPGTYVCQGLMYYTDANGLAQQASSNTKEGTVAVP